MAQFILSCPNCGAPTNASTSIFKKKILKCSACGFQIDTRQDRLSSRTCPTCGKYVVYDQSKGESAICPNCHSPINPFTGSSSLTSFACPTCSCKITADSASDIYVCPLCDTTIDVQKEISKKKAKDSGVISVIKCERKDNYLVWKHPVEDFNFGSQLVVHETQEAVFFRDGRALDTFIRGAHTLKTKNLPHLQNAYKIDANTDQFHSEVYFVNKAPILGILWGTPSKIKVLDKNVNLYFDIGARGTFGIQVTDSRKVMEIVGTKSEFTASITGDDSESTSFMGIFGGLFQQVLTTGLASIIQNKNISILEMNQHLDEIGKELMPLIGNGLEKYGISMVEFFLTGVALPEDDPNFRRYQQQFFDSYLKVREQEILKNEALAAGEVKKAKAMIDGDIRVMNANYDAAAYRMKASAEADEMRMKGYSYKDETARQIGVGAVSHEYSGSGGGNGANPIGDVASLGMTLGVMKEVLETTKSAVSSNDPSEKELPKGWTCSCGTQNRGKFCEMCGKPSPIESTWQCVCGQVNSGNFCGNCGKARPITVSWLCSCGAMNTGNFCGNCGSRKPEEK